MRSKLLGCRGAATCPFRALAMAGIGMPAMFTRPKIDLQVQDVRTLRSFSTDMHLPVKA